MKGGRREGGWDGSTRFTSWRQEPIVVGTSHSRDNPERPAASWWTTAEREGFTRVAEKEYERLKGTRMHLNLPVKVSE